MSTNGIESSGSVQGSGHSQQAQRAEAAKASEQEKPEQRVAGHDRAEISDAARELARLAGAQPAETAVTRSLDAEHVRTIMTKLADGFYDSPEVQLEIANRIRSAGHDPMSGTEQQ